MSAMVMVKVWIPPNVAYVGAAMVTTTVSFSSSIVSSRGVTMTLADRLPAGMTRGLAVAA